MGAKLAAVGGFLKSAGSKAAPLLKSGASGLGKAGGAAAPMLKNVAGGAGKAFGNVAGGVGNVVNAGGAATQAIAWEGGRQVVDSIKDPGFVLFIVGLIAAFTGLFEGTALALLVSTILMFIAAIFIFKGKSLFFVFVFWLFYLVIGIDNLTLYSMLLYLSGCIIFGMFAHGLFSKVNSKPFMEGAMGELIGLVPVIIFLIDVGIIQWVMTKYNFFLPVTLNSLIIYTPWWALLGLFTTKKENALITISKFVAIVYLFLFIFGALTASSAYGEGGTLSGVPNAQELLASKQTFEEQNAKAENPAYSNLMCIMQNPSDINNCVEKRQEDSLFKDTCNRIEKLAIGSNEYNKCIEEQKEKKSKQQYLVNGINDPTIKQPTKIELKFNEFFPKTTTRTKDGELLVQYPIEIYIANPRNQQFLVSVDCNFTSTKDNKVNFFGKITGGDSYSIPGTESGVENVWKVSGETPLRTFKCTPPKDRQLDGGYKITYIVNVTGLNTTSRLQRAFIGDKSDDWKKEWIPKIMNTHFSGGTSKSQSPNDLAKVNFAFGNPLDYPIIEAKNGQVSLFLFSNIENQGSGRILAIKEFRVGFIDDMSALSNEFYPNTNIYSELSEYNPSDQNCLEGKDIPIPKDYKTAKEKIPLPSCTLQSIPTELATDLKINEYVYTEFEAYLSYDYQLTKENTIEVKVVE